MRRFILLFLPLFLAGPARADVQLAPATTATFATVEDARKILTQRDEFITQLSPFDRSARMKTDREVSEKEFLEFLPKNVLPWTDQEKQAVESALKALKPSLDALALPFPPVISLVKTSGNEEGHAAYCRGSAIILPVNEIAQDPKALQGLLAHELFHILSRAAPQLRERLYGAVGFSKCDEVELPAALKPRKITNPDAPRNDHCIRLQGNGQPVWAIPILYAATDKYNTARGGEFFNYLTVKLLLVERDEAGHVKVLDSGNGPQLLDLLGNRAFNDQVGRNTSYTIHPEEILADNFKLLVLGAKQVPSPEVLERIRTILTTQKDVAPSTTQSGRSSGAAR